MKILKLISDMLLPALLVGLITILSWEFIDSSFVAVLPVILATSLTIFIKQSTYTQKILKKLESLSNSNSTNIYKSIDIIESKLINISNSESGKEKNYKKTKAVIENIENDLKKIITDFNWVLEKAAEVGGKTEEQKTIIKDTASGL